jgi:hypothetical protein
MDAEAHGRSHSGGLCDGRVRKRGPDIGRRRQVAVAESGEGPGRQDVGRQGGRPRRLCQVCAEREVRVRREGFGCGCSHRQGKQTPTDGTTLFPRERVRRCTAWIVGFF